MSLLCLTSWVLLSPKSIIFSLQPSLEDCRRRFSGFKSLCVTSCWCRYSMPSTYCMINGVNVELPGIIYGVGVGGGVVNTGMSSFGEFLSFCHDWSGSKNISLQRWRRRRKRSTRRPVGTPGRLTPHNKPGSTGERQTKEKPLVPEDGSEHRVG